jgi:hypothetical protein
MSAMDQAKPSIKRGGKGRLFRNAGLVLLFSVALRATEMVAMGGATPLSALFDVAASDLTFAKETVVDPALELVRDV